MELSTYTTLTRQTGLLREMQIVANNIANTATTGYRQEGLVFSEYLAKGGTLSMAHGNIPRTSFTQGALETTGNSLDVSIEGEGFFQIGSPNGPRLTRSGHFSRAPTGDLVTPDGYPVLDIGEAPIFVPPDAGQIHIAGDGTISADGTVVGQLGIVLPQEGAELIREDGVLFAVKGEMQPTDTARVLQGHLETSNTDPIGQLARMIEIQRAYEMGQKLIETETDRQKSMLKALKG